MAKRKEEGTTRAGFINRNGQKNLGRCKPLRSGNDNNQYVYIMQCGKCKHKYGSNGSDIFQRKCPSCDEGKEGPELYEGEKS